MFQAIHLSTLREFFSLAPGASFQQLVPAVIALAVALVIVWLIPEDVTSRVARFVFYGLLAQYYGLMYRWYGAKILYVERRREKRLKRIAYLEKLLEERRRAKSE